MLAWLLVPGPVERYRPHADPALDHRDALRRFEALKSRDGGDVASECGALLLDHGARTGQAVVMFHGLTNCPAQFESLARIVHARGANVLVPRLPRHGFADRMTPALAGLDARELVEAGDRAIDIAVGLGDTVTVVGLSVGGTLAAWAAQEREDVHRAVLIAPMIGAARAPGAWSPVVARVAGRLPNLFVWWDDKRKLDLPGPKHVYPRFASRAIAATLALGGSVTASAAARPPGARNIIMVTVGGDEAVDNGACRALVEQWRRRREVAVSTFEFPAELHLNHDVVDPRQHGGNPAITYPVFERLIGR